MFILIFNVLFVLTIASIILACIPFIIIFLEQKNK